ncbi:bZIP transcription factor [Tissierella sp. Yu-01]|uniref:bZIP transcription factor n=1 Tax=Tissierella sp. Yu-01 TaxID=3035694 RepID=UPI00240D4C0E|nr:bZIP transcription factor [Tissierella sp. Yu-01]WFA09112.1 bZIP transcription factor [Tissierella sp. Yu-01]
MNKRIRFVLMTLLLLLLFSSCTPVADKELQEELEAKNEIITSLERENKELEDRITELEQEVSNNPIDPESNNLLYTASKVVNLLKNKDMEGVSAYVHPSKGVRFSPYGTIDVESDQVFIQNQVAELLSDSQSYTWGNYDGTGDPIDLNYNDYYNRFIYDVDFANPHMIGNNVAIGKGNTLNNITEAYPNGEFIEFHFTGYEAKYEGLDWKSLRLVFEEDNGIYYLIGIVHDEWTI